MDHTKPVPPSLEPGEQPKKSRSISWIGLLAAVAAAVLVKSVMGGKPSHSLPDSGYGPSEGPRADNETYERFLQLAVERWTPKLPIKQEDGIVWDSVSAGPGLVFSYHYTVPGMKAQINPAELNEDMRPGLVENYRSLREMKPFREMKAELRYIFRDKNHEEITTVTITAEDLLRVDPMGAPESMAPEDAKGGGKRNRKPTEAELEKAMREGDSQVFLPAMAAKANKKLPEEVEPGTSLYAVIEGPKVLTYYYRMMKVTANEVPQSEIDDMRSKFIARYKGTGEMKVLREQGVAVRVNCINQTRQLIMEFTVDPKDL